MAVTPAERTMLAAARLLAARGMSAADEVLVGALGALGCTELSLRTRGDVPLQPRGGRWVLDAPLRAAGEVHGVLTASADTPFTVDQADLLTGLADLLALTLDAAAGRAARDAGRGVLDAEADRAQVAAAMHETVGQALVTLRYTAEQVAAGRAGAGQLDEPVRAAMAAFRVAHRDLRAYALDAGLRSALREMSVRGGGDRPADDRPALRVEVCAEDPALDALAPPVAVTVQRVAEAALRGAAGKATVAATYDGRGVKLRVESAEIAYDASELDRWARRASALGGELRVTLAGVELDLPAQLPAREGHHDDGPDL
jgi:hypothetical protein